MKTVISMPSTQFHDAAGDNEGDEVPSTTSVGVAGAAPERSSGLHSHAHAHARAQPAVSTPHSPFVPLLLGGLALLGWMGFQTQQLLQEREALQAAHASQQQTVDNAGKLRGSLDALAADTQRIADAGNPNARLLVDELRKRGITINPSATTAAKPSSP